MPISAGSSLCPPFIQDELQHRREISRWMNRVSLRIVYVEDFGAVGDGATDDTDAFNAALIYLGNSGNGGIVRTLSRFYRIDGTININGNSCTLEGTGWGGTTTLYKPTCTDPVISVTGLSCTVRNFRILGVVGSTGNNFAIYVNAVASVFRILEVEIFFFANGILLLSGKFLLDNVSMQSLRIASGVAIQIDQSALTDGVGIIHNCYVENAVGEDIFSGLYMVHAVGIVITNTSFLKCGSAVSMVPKGAGNGITACDFNTCTSDTSSGAGIFIDTTPNGGRVERIRYVNGWLCSNQYGIRAIAGSNLNSIVVDACECFDNSVNGFDFGNSLVSDNIQIANCVFSHNTGTDLKFGTSLSSFSVCNCKTGVAGNFGTATPNGLLIGTACSEYVLSGNRFHQVTINASMPSLSCSATVTLALNQPHFNLIGSGSISVALNGFLGREATLFVNKDIVVFRHNGLLTNGLSLNNNIDYTASTGATLSLVHNGSQWFEKSRKI